MRTRAFLAAALLLAAPGGPSRAEISFGDPLILPAGGDPTAVTATDLTGDGVLDLVAVHRASDDAWVWIGDGNGGFSFLQSFDIGPFPQGIAAGDFNADGKADIATTAVAFSDGHVTAWLGNGDGAMDEGADLPIIGTSIRSPKTLLHFVWNAL